MGGNWGDATKNEESMDRIAHKWKQGLLRDPVDLAPPASRRFPGVPCQGCVHRLPVHTPIVRTPQLRGSPIPHTLTSAGCRSPTQALNLLCSCYPASSPWHCRWSNLMPEIIQPCRITGRYHHESDGVKWEHNELLVVYQLICSLASCQTD